MFTTPFTVGPQKFRAAPALATSNSPPLSLPAGFFIAAMACLILVIPGYFVYAALAAWGTVFLAMFASLVAPEAKLGSSEAGSSGAAKPNG